MPTVTTDATTGLEELEVFDSFAEAARLANDLARSHETGIFVRATNSRFQVLVPGWVRQYVESTDAWRRRHSDSTDGYDDEDAERYNASQLSESDSDLPPAAQPESDSYDRANEDGWFYPDDDESAER